MDMNYFKEELERAMQNDTDIEGWYKEGYINEQEYIELKRFNRKLCR